jgi:hypothetical protein
MHVPRYGNTVGYYPAGTFPAVPSSLAPPPRSVKSTGFGRSSCPVLPSPVLAGPTKSSTFPVAGQVDRHRAQPYPTRRATSPAFPTSLPHARTFGNRWCADKVRLMRRVAMRSRIQRRESTLPHGVCRASVRARCGATVSHGVRAPQPPCPGRVGPAAPPKYTRPVRWHTGVGWGKRDILKCVAYVTSQQVYIW